MTMGAVVRREGGDLAPAAMRHTLVALAPGAALYVAAFGYGVALNAALAAGVAVAVEAAALRCRGLPARTVRDGSAVLTAVLLALALPPNLAWWITVVAVVVAILLGKQFYGGLGNNLFNPAMVGYCFVLLAFPLDLTLWPPAGARFDVAHTFDFALGAGSLDALTGQTSLEHWRGAGEFAPPENWYWAGFLAGGAWLLYRRVIAWPVPVAMLATVALGAWIAQPEATSPWFHWTTGATMLGAFFIATDPATSPDTLRGRLLFGAGVGALLLLIRYQGVYIDGLAFAVLLMNMLTPLLNRLSAPR